MKAEMAIIANEPGGNEIVRARANVAFINQFPSEKIITLYIAHPHENVNMSEAYVMNDEESYYIDAERNNISSKEIKEINELIMHVYEINMKLEKFRQKK